MAYNKLFGETLAGSRQSSFGTPSLGATPKHPNEPAKDTKYHNDFRTVLKKEFLVPSMQGAYEDFDLDISPTSSSRSMFGLKGQKHKLDLNSTGSRWNPGVKAQFPWAGVVAFVVAVGATIGCVAVLCASDNVSIESWNGTFQPTVYLSIGTAIANIALAYALYNGAQIYFWRKLAHGTTLPEVHRYWGAAHSLEGALESLFHAKGQIMSIACIFTFISILRGPLLQRAASVKNVTVRTSGAMTMLSALELPSGYAGSATGRTTAPAYMNPNFTTIVQDYTAGMPIMTKPNACGTTCHASVQGFGFGVNCNTSAVPYQLMPELFSNGSFGQFPTTQVFGADASTTPADLDSDDPYSSQYAALLLNTTLMATPIQSSNGSMLQHLCALRGGVVSYQVVVSNNTIQLKSDNWMDDKFLEDRPLYWPESYGEATNLAGFILAIQGIYKGTATLYFGGAVGYEMDLVGSSANRYLDARLPGQNYWNIGNNMTWTDPMNDMINTARELAFRTSLQLAIDNTTNANATQRVDYTGEHEQTVYTTNCNYMVGGVIASFAGILAVLPTFWGFWELGRPVSMSPLEIAKAFGAPLLAGVPGNRRAEDMVKTLGKGEVRYGDAGPTSDPGARKIEIGPTRIVEPAHAGTIYK